MTNKKGFEFSFFLANARLLSDKEVSDLPPEQVNAAGAEGAEGLWIKISCPDGSCLDDQGRIRLPIQEEKERGIFLELFCPEGSCEITESTDLP